MRGGGVISKTSVTKYLASELKKYRKISGMSGSELACRLNISQQQVSRYERGINSLNMEMLFLYFRALEMKDNEVESVFNELIFKYSEGQKMCFQSSSN